MPYPAPARMAPDTPTIKTNSDFLDIHLFSNQAPQDRKMWQTDVAKLALFHQDTIPYVLVTFPRHRVTFDCPFNILRVPDEIRSLWFTSEKSMAKLILASYPTNLFFGMQLIDVAWAAELRRVSREGIERYGSAEAIDRQSHYIEDRVSTAQMWLGRWQL